jgi:predicted nuclease of predicted toxin-antitoxin system
MDRAIVLWVRSQGHTVVWAAEECPGASDETVLRIANDTGSILLAKDLDFGEMVFRRSMVARGIVLLRTFRLPVQEHLNLLIEHWDAVASHGRGHFVVLGRGQARVRPLVMRIES